MAFNPWDEVQGSQQPTEEEMLMAFMQQQQAQAPVQQTAQVAPPMQQGAPAPAPAPSNTTSMLERLRGAERRALNQQKEGIGTYENAIQGILSKQQQGVDLTPLAALTDSWTGSRLTGAAQAQKPMTAEQRAVLAAKLQDELQKRKGDYSQAQLASMKTQLMFQLGLDKTAKGVQLPISEVEKISDAKSSQVGLEKLNKLIQNNPELYGPGTGLVTRIQAYTGLGETGRKGRVAAAEMAALTQIIGKGLEGGKLTDADINRYAGMMPVFGDEPEVAKAKIDSIQDLINDKLKTSVTTARQAGYNTSAIEMPVGNYSKPGVSAPLIGSGPTPSAPSSRLEQLRAKYKK